MNDTWEAMPALDHVTGDDRLKIFDFCESKRIDIVDLAALGTRWNGTELAWAALDGERVTAIKYRRLEDGQRRSERGSRFDRPIIAGNPLSLSWFIAEGETDAARILGLSDGGAVLVLPSGATSFKAEWSWLIPRGAEVFMCHDADQAGDQGAEKAMRMVKGSVRLRPPGGDWCEWDGDGLEFSQLLSTANEESERESGLISIASALQDLEAEFKEPPSLDDVSIPAPFDFLDPFRDGRLYILGGYMGDGKTAASVQFLETAANANKYIGYISVEMSWRDLRDRAVAAAGVPYEKVQDRSAYQNPEVRHLAEQAIARLSRWKVDIVDNGDITVEMIAQLQRAKQWDMLIIDHLHRFRYEDRRDLELIVRGITNLAKEADIPILLLAQLRRPDHTPQPSMHMLRESGMIEAEAARVDFVWRPRDLDGIRGSAAKYIVAKNRFGVEVNRDLYFDGDNVRFHSTTIPPLQEAAA
jgi:KaiC/GvpD/RAD55 family RecA-like ATPase